MMQNAGHDKLVPDTRSQRTIMLRKKLAYVRGNNYSERAFRFKNIMASGAVAQEHQSFESVASLPDWILLDTKTQDLIGACAAILSERAAIERELSGERLSAISAIVGNALFEDLCEVPLPPQADKLQNTDAGRRLSRPEDFAAIGQELRAKAVQYSFGLGETKNYPRVLCDIAASVVSGSDVNRAQTADNPEVGGV